MVFPIDKSLEAMRDARAQVEYIRHDIWNITVGNAAIQDLSANFSG